MPITSIIRHSRGMNETAGQAVFIIKIDDSQAKSDLQSWQQNLSSTMEKSTQDTRGLADALGGLQSSIAQLATAGASFIGLTSGIGSVVDAYNQFESSMNGVKAVARATGNDVADSLSSIKDLTSNGLISQSEAASAMKSLQKYGYSVQEATEMIKIMTDAAVYNRQAHYSVGEAIEATAQGIAQENSNLSDGVGITTNIAKMHENYAKSLGKTTNELTQAEKAQAVYNGYMQEGGIFAGNAEEYSNTLAGSQQKLETSIRGVNQTLGAMFAAFGPVINSLADWISENQELVAGIVTFVGIIAGGSGLVAASKLAASALGTINAALTALVGKTILAKVALLGVVGVIAALVAGTLVAAGSSALEEMSTSMDEAGDSSKDASNALDVLGGTAESTAKKIAKLRQQLATLERDYRRDLKQIAVNHEENLQTLTEQIEEANVDYKRAIDERMAEFNVTMAKQERSHQETVDELMTQLAFLQRYNNEYNKQKLAQVQFALAKEEQLYKNETEKQRAEIELQNAADKQKLDQKLESLQKELDDEMAFMNKHRDALNGVRDVILLDEIESLRERYEEQKKNYEEQIVEARISGAKVAQSIEDGLKTKDFANIGREWGAQIIDGIFERLNQGFRKVDQWVQDNLAGKVIGFDKGIKTGNFWEDTRKAVFGFSSGGYTGRGAPDEVAGVVHRGEYVVPANQVDQNTGKPMMGGNQFITIKVEGVLADSPQAKRAWAQQIVRAIEQTNQSKLYQGRAI